jgi:hypothetical protein
MSSFGKNQLTLDTTSLSESDNVGAYVRSSDGTLITHTTNGGKDSLDVNISNTSIAVTATNLDIRDLAFATDKVDVSGSSVELGATTLAALENISAIVTATDLDIRNLDYSQDNIAIKGSTGNQLVVNADGSINANVDVSVVSGAEKAEDSAHTSTDVGQFSLAVRHDADTSMVSADGDYAPFQVNATGALKVAGTFTQSSASDILAQSITVGTTEVALPATPMVNRREIIIQNNGNKFLYIGETGVTSSTGLIIGPKSEASFEFGPSVILYGISTAAAQDIRVIEVS